MIDEVGMSIDKVKIDVQVISDLIEEEAKIEAALIGLKDKLKDAYSSSNSSNVVGNSIDIANSVHVKLKNLKSYKMYTEKYISKYSTTLADAITASKENVEPLG